MTPKVYLQGTLSHKPLPADLTMQLKILGVHMTVVFIQRRAVYTAVLAARLDAPVPSLGSVCLAVQHQLVAPAVALVADRAEIWLLPRVFALVSLHVTTPRPLVRAVIALEHSIHTWGDLLNIITTSKSHFS